VRRRGLFSLRTFLEIEVRAQERSRRACCSPISFFLFFRHLITAKPPQRPPQGFFFFFFSLAARPLDERRVPLGSSYPPNAAESAQLHSLFPFFFSSAGAYPVLVRRERGLFSPLLFFFFFFPSPLALLFGILVGWCLLLGLDVASAYKSSHLLEFHPWRSSR